MQELMCPGCCVPYYATETLEVLFHVATLLQPALINTQDKEGKARRSSYLGDELVKKRWVHIGNDSVLIVWNEHSNQYRPDMFSTQV